MEEVDTFLNNQLHLQPDIRHKLLSHCREQLTGSDVTPEPEQPSRVAPLRSTSPENDLKFVLRGVVCDSGSDTSSDDETRVRSSCHAEDVKPASVAATSEPAEAAATATAFVAPFQHTSTTPASSAPSQTPVQQTSSADTNGIKLAGPLKLICGGNVFIVVDQHQQASSKAPEVLQSVSSPPTLGGQLFYSPSVYSTSAFTTYIPTLPQVNVSGCVGVPAASTIPLLTTRVGCSSAVSQKLDKEPESLVTTYPSVGPRECGLSPPVQPSPEVSCNAGNDVNNNEVNLVHQASSVWRPW